MIMQRKLEGVVEPIRQNHKTGMFNANDLFVASSKEREGKG